MGNEVSRRAFLKGAGVAGLAAGAMAGGAVPAFAADASEIDAPYMKLATDTMYVPVAKASCPGPIGPIGFEDRDIDPSEITSEEDYDVVVVGAGIAGLMAALKAAEEGANVICIEKMTMGRGCFECFGAIGASCQEGIELNPLGLKDEMLRSAYWRVRPDAINTYVDRSGEATDFWQAMLDKGDKGFIIRPTGEAPSPAMIPVDPSITIGELGFYESPCLPPDAGVRSGYSGVYVCLEMQEVAKQYENLQLRFQTPGVQVIKEGNRAVAVIAKFEDEYIKLNAAKGVILATGGYDCNPALMEAWTRPEDYVTSSWWNPGWGTTGDGHMMGLKVGAQMDPCPQPVMNFRWGNPDSFYDVRTWNAIYFGLVVNSKGERFVREDLPFQAISNAQNAQPGYGKGCFEVFDDMMMDGMDEACIADFEARGWLFEGNTPQELGEAAGIDGEALAATIARYNSYFETGVDEEFMRDLTQTMPFMGTKYYALTTNSCVLATVGGLTINANCQVLDTNDEVIEGLYAVGNASGNFFAGNYPRHIPGTSIGRAITFGYVAAEHAVKGE